MSQDLVDLFIQLSVLVFHLAILLVTLLGSNTRFLLEDKYKPKYLEGSHTFTGTSRAIVNRPSYKAELAPSISPSRNFVSQKADRRHKIHMFKVQSGQ